MAYHSNRNGVPRTGLKVDALLTKIEDLLNATQSSDGLLSKEDKLKLDTQVASIQETVALGQRIDALEIQAGGMVSLAYTELNNKIETAQQDANKANDDIDKTVMRVYRDGGYNMNSCLWYGWWFSCTLGRPSGSIEGEKYTLCVTNAGNDTTIYNRNLDNSIIDTFNTVDAWNVDINQDNNWPGTYSIEGNTYIERFGYVYPAAGHYVFRNIIELPNGTYNVKVLVGVSSTTERDNIGPVEEGDIVAVLQVNSVNINIPRPNNIVRTAIASTDGLYLAEANLVAVTDNRLVLELKSRGNFGNWFVIKLNSLKMTDVAGYSILKQECASDVDNNRRYHRLLYSADRNKPYPPFTFYTDWEKKTSISDIDNFNITTQNIDNMFND